MYKPHFICVCSTNKPGLPIPLQVLGIFPTTIRRRILRQLYSNSLQGCYLFKDTGVKFLDALMLGARVELFLPKVRTRMYAVPMAYKGLTFSYLCSCLLIGL